MYLLDGVQTRPFELSILQLRWTSEAIRKFAEALQAQQTSHDLSTPFAVCEELSKQAAALEEWWKQVEAEKTPYIRD